MTLPNDEDLAALLAYATPGPWDLDRHGADDCLADVWLRDEWRVCENAEIANAALIAHAPDLARAVLDLRAEVARLTAERDACLDALAAIERLARSLSISSCSCGTKSPDIQFHDGRCRYVLAQYILGQAEDALAIRAAAEGAP